MCLEKNCVHILTLNQCLKCENVKNNFKNMGYFQQKRGMSSDIKNLASHNFDKGFILYCMDFLIFDKIYF